MSESGDSFEEIGLMKSGLSGSASINDQESSNLNNGDQHPSTERPANTSNPATSNSTMSNSTDQTKTGQLKELEFELEWKTRKAIIDHLDQHTKLLSGLIIEPDAREAMRKANGDLMLALLNLPVKVGGRWKRFESRLPASGLNEVVLELNPDVRSRIVDTLMANHHVALLAGDSVENECKSKLVEKNNDLICELLKLKSRMVSKEDHRIDQVVKTSESQTNRSVAVNEENHAGESEITFTASLYPVDNSDRTSINKLKSEAFHFRGIPLYLCVGPWKEDGLYYMSLHLETDGIIDKDWSTVKSGEYRNFVGSGKLGWNKFIPARKLYPFKRNDEIQIRVHLST